tara:strand:+ start:21 stop:758 length:738 start_codon:yes stop_codon:yes gene_type:complete
MQINPYLLANIAKGLTQSKQTVSNVTELDSIKKSKFKGQTTDIFRDMLRDKDKEISKRLGQSSGGTGIDSLGRAVAMAPVDPITKAIVTSITTILGGSSRRKKMKRAITDSEKMLSSLDTKYEKSWLGNHLKDFVTGYEKQFTDMRQSLPSTGDVLLNAIISGITSYATAGGAKEQARIDAGGEIGGWGSNIKDIFAAPTTNSPDGFNINNLFKGLSTEARDASFQGGYDNLIQKLLTYGEGKSL